jgi:rhodanese-related sulfurtransferase
MQINTLKEILLIIIVAVAISLVYNTIYENGLPLVRKGIQLNWENDSSIDSLIINTEPILKKDNILNKSSEAVLNTNNDKVVAQTTQSEEKITPENSTPKQSVLTSKDIVDSSQTDTLQKGEPIAEDKNITPTAITLEQAHRLYNAGVLFIDARMEAEYNFGHIRGAINLPFKKIDEHISKISNLPKNTALVTYCDGVGCDASIDLANKLAELGYTNVRIFYSGWNDWRDQNYPME